MPDRCSRRRRCTDRARIRHELSSRTRNAAARKTHLSSHMHMPCACMLNACSCMCTCVHRRVYAGLTGPALCTSAATLAAVGVESAISPARAEEPTRRVACTARLATVLCTRARTRTRGREERETGDACKREATYAYTRGREERERETPYAHAMHARSCMCACVHVCTCVVGRRKRLVPTRQEREWWGRPRQTAPYACACI